MTREEATKIIKDYEVNGCGYCHQGGDEVEEAFKMAIEALEQEPTAKENLEVEDCISRVELLKAVDTWDKFGCDADLKLVPIKDCYIPYIHYDDVVKAIKGMPSVQPKPKTGRWIGHREHCENLGVMPSGLGAYEWCSNCDCGIDVREWHRNNYNFCPNCGVKMLPTGSDCGSCEYQNEVDGSNCYECVKGIRDNYKAVSESEVSNETYSRKARRDRQSD